MFVKNIGSEQLAILLSRWHLWGQIHTLMVVKGGRVLLHFLRQLCQEVLHVQAVEDHLPSHIHCVLLHLQPKLVMKRQYENAIHCALQSLVLKFSLTVTFCYIPHTGCLGRLNCSVKCCSHSGLLNIRPHSIKKLTPS